MAAIIVKDLRKTYGNVAAVDGLSFEVADGEVCALLGPNGAGKTTTVEILEGHRPATSGEVSVLGFDPATGGRAYRERIGIVLQEAGFDDEQTVRELVGMYAGFFPDPHDADELIDLVGLTEKRTARVKALSGGQRRRLDLALGLVGRPKVLFLDEPTTGFDPSARRQAWELIDRLRGGGTTILLTTHYLDEAQHLADQIIVIAAGRLTWQGTPEALIARTGHAAVIGFDLPAGVAAADLPRLPGQLRVNDQRVEVETADPTEALHTLTGWALAGAAPLSGLALARRSLEEAYLDLVREAAPDDG
jgi:ABC-type multidrug transport system ATPase subunit